MDVEVVGGCKWCTLEDSEATNMGNRVRVRGEMTEKRHDGEEDSGIVGGDSAIVVDTKGAGIERLLHGVCAEVALRNELLAPADGAVCIDSCRYLLSAYQCRLKGSRLTIDFPVPLHILPAYFIGALYTFC